MRYILALVLLLNHCVFAGEAIIPFWQMSQYSSFTLTISNVSNEEANVTVQFINKDGSLYQGAYRTDNSTGNGAALNEPFILAAHQTAWIWLHGSTATTIESTQRGFGVINSRALSEQHNQPALVEFGKYDGSGSHRWMSVPVNNGLPF